MTTRRDHPRSLSEWVLGLFLPRDKAASILGDLEEERSRRGERVRWPGAWWLAQICGYAIGAMWLGAARFVASPTTIRLDLRDAVRTVRWFPGSTAIAFIVLTLSIAAGTVTFSVVDTVVLRRLPFPEDDRLITIYATTPEAPPSMSVSAADYFAWRDGTAAFEGLSTWHTGVMRLQFGSETEDVLSVLTTANLFAVLRTPPFIGEPFREEHEIAGRDNVAVISYGLWQRRFGSDALAIGRTLSTTDGLVTILGVMPKDFTFPVEFRKPIDVYRPYVAKPGERTLAPATGRRSYLQIIGRLSDGVPLERANAEVERVTGSLAAQHPQLYRNWRPHVTSLLDGLVGRVRGWMLVTLWAVALVMVVACANVANLLLARSTARARDIAVRASLGATRGQITQLLLVESLLLSVAAAAAGIWLAWWMLGVVKAALPVDIARTSAIALDLRVLAASIAAAVVTGLVFGAVPAWSASRIDLVEMLKDGGATTPSPARRRWRSALLVAEVAFVGALLVATTLLVGSFVRVMRADLGFTRQNLAGVRLTPSFPGVTQQQRGTLARELSARVVESVRSLPGVADVATMTGGDLPLYFGSSTTQISSPASPGVEPMRAELRQVSPGYFETTGIAIRAGHAFTDADVSGTAMIIDDVAARRLFGSRNPLGATVKLPFPGEFTVVGIVSNVRLLGPEGETGPQVYLPITRPPLTQMLLVRTAVPPAHIARGIEAAIGRLLPAGSQPPRVEIVDEQFQRITADRRFNAGIMATFGLLALVIGVVGIYGVTASLVAQQTREIGVRMALGASAAHIVTSIAADIGRLLAIGATIGMAAAWGTSNVFASLVFGLQPTDVVVYAVPFAVLLVAGGLAAVVPALRASRVDPLVALRQA